MEKVFYLADENQLPPGATSIADAPQFLLISIDRKSFNLKELVAHIEPHLLQSNSPMTFLLNLESEYSRAEIECIKTLAEHKLVTLAYSYNESKSIFNKIAAYKNHGFINANASIRAWLFAIRSIQSCGSYWPDYLQSELLVAESQTYKRQSISSELTVRQYQVLRAINEGKSNQQIAAQMAVTTHTVKSHIAAIYKKLKVNNRTHCLKEASKQGLLKIAIK